MIAKKRKKKRGSRKSEKRNLIFGILIFSLIIYLVMSNLRINWQRTELSEKLTTLKQTSQSFLEEKEKLNLLLNQTLSQAFLEKVAREDLNLKKPGEKVVVIKKEEPRMAPSESEKNPFFLKAPINWLKEKFQAFWRE